MNKKEVLNEKYNVAFNNESFETKIIKLIDFELFNEIKNKKS